MKKKLISILLALSMMLQMCGMAAAVTTPASGTCGDYLTWSLSADGVLTISGSGDMTDYSSNSQVPWLKDYGFSKINRVVIGDQVTRIGNWAFYNCVNMTSLQLGSSVTEIGSSAFSVCTGLESVEMNILAREGQLSAE